MGLIRVISNRRRVLGMNERNLEYIRPYNKSRAVKIADNKILTKKKLQHAGIPVPPLITVIKNHQQLGRFNFDTLPPSFVIKPVNGVEGGGIELFYNRVGENWIKGDKSKVDVAGLKARFEEILDGRYSLHNQPDWVMVEERIKPHKDFRYYTYKGTPDVRVLVFNNIPIMSYIRLPTEESDGKANLALGAIGAAIDIAAGRVTTSIIGKIGEIEYVPSTKVRLSGLRIPYWNKILEYAVRAQQATNLGFAAVDFLIDREQGPMIVELNARPGLSIQLANQDGLRWRLEKVKGIKVKTVEQGIRLGKDLFGGEIEETVENVTGKQVIGLVEEVIIYGKNEAQEVLKAKIDTGADATSVDRKLLERIGFGEILAQFDEFIAKESQSRNLNELVRGDAGKIADELSEKVRVEVPGIQKVVAVFSSHGASYRPYLEVEMEMSGIKFPTLCSAYDRSNLSYSVIIGKNSLRKFLIDPVK